MSVEPIVRESAPLASNLHLENQWSSRLAHSDIYALTLVDLVHCIHVPLVHLSSRPCLGCLRESMDDRRHLFSRLVEHCVVRKNVTVLAYG